MTSLPHCEIILLKALMWKNARAALQTVCLIFLFHIAPAQVLVKGNVSGEKKNPIQYVTVSVSQGKTSLATTFTDSIGNYQFKNLAKGSYKFLFHYVSFADTAASFTINSDTIIDMQFQNSKLLPTAEVRARKQVIQMLVDRLRFNVAGTDLVFGNSIWDVIEKTPLVTTSSDGNIQIKGTTGAIVYINNKRKVLSGNELKSYLSAMPAGNLVAIEVITTPSSRYDAEGGAGILNIITKKKKEDGVEGSASLSARQTKVNSQAGSLFLNSHKDKWNIYSTVYASNRRRKPDFTQDIYFPAPANPGLNSRHISASSLTEAFTYGGNAGIDYQFNKNHVAGLIVDYSGTRDKKARIANNYDDYLGITDSLTFSNNDDRLNANTYSLNMNYEGKLDASGKTLSVDFDALKYISTNNSVSKTEVLDATPDKVLYVRDYFRSAAPQKVSNQSLKTDFQWPINENTSLDLGAKVSSSKIDNTLLFENNTAINLWVKDNSRSNLFRYDENIIAAYFVLNRTINAKWAYQLGVRLENTIAKGYLEGTKVVDRNYTSAFPTGFLKYNATPEKAFVLALSSRITRPSYWDVNPFRAYTTDRAYFEGNPFLQPSRYYRQELSHNFDTKKGNCTFQLAAGQTLNEFYSLPYNDTANILVHRKTNYGNKYSYSATAIYSVKPKPWWRLSATGLVGYIISKGGYAGIPIDNQSSVISISTNQTFTLSKKKGLTCTVIANNTFPFTIVNTRVADRLETEIRIRKSAGPFNITLSGADFFKSNRDRYQVSANDLRLNQNFYNDTRSVALAMSYNFGKSTVKSKRDRNAEFENVKGRIN
jgi:hypothetical protein